MFIVYDTTTGAMKYTEAQEPSLSGLTGLAAVAAPAGFILGPNGCTVTDGVPVNNAPPPPPSAAPVYIPASIVRERLQAAGQWDAAAAALASNPSNMLWFATLELGVSPTDPTATALLESIGANPATILAPYP